MPSAKPNRASFDTIVAASGNNTGIGVLVEVLDQLAAGKRPPVLVKVNGYEYRNTVGVMGGQAMISISAAIRSATGLTGGDPIHVTLTVADTPREVDVPVVFAAALAADEQAQSFFGQLSNSMQRFHVDQHHRREERRYPATPCPRTRTRQLDQAASHDPKEDGRPGTPNQLG